MKWMWGRLARILLSEYSGLFGLALVVSRSAKAASPFILDAIIEIAIVLMGAMPVFGVAQAELNTFKKKSTKPINVKLLTVHTLKRVFLFNKNY